MTPAFRFTNQVNTISRLGKLFSNKELNTKLLRALTRPNWYPFAMCLRRTNLNSVTPDYIFSVLKSEEFEFNMPQASSVEPECHLITHSGQWSAPPDHVLQEQVNQQQTL